MWLFYFVCGSFVSSFSYKEKQPVVLPELLKKRRGVLSCLLKGPATGGEQTSVRKNHAVPATCTGDDTVVSILQFANSTFIN